MTRRLCLAALLTLTASTAFAAPSYDRLYAFGDSYSDNGAGEVFTRGLAKQKVKDAQELPSSLYWKGRWSNGPTAVEDLANALVSSSRSHKAAKKRNGISDVIHDLT